eukprot:CAMPEP_0168736416 /NCGR_PEP_ID=MMETSP0724-20121128/9850_1 /TAXON_ID=265536 /ORGANISM="Amphiprora sp., Strain CCMP467" /LENGTH=122 /DNA_ID=CAMNT_0008783615 /DNA_START=588 /DNA_END=957 /DNA_ORIENTATION=+
MMWTNQEFFNAEVTEPPTSTTSLPAHQAVLKLRAVGKQKLMTRASYLARGGQRAEGDLISIGISMHPFSGIALFSLLGVGRAQEGVHEEELKSPRIPSGSCPTRHGNKMEHVCSSSMVLLKK